ncbi:lipoprotein [Saccharospirillum sp. MSK14-1]|nr:lipoprotein [Saccharospirillum sp. MSK14-1]
MFRMIGASLCSLFLVVGLTGCGQKSDLYLPDESARTLSTTQQQDFIQPS